MEAGAFLEKAERIAAPVPTGVPASLLDPVESPFRQLVLRWARARGPFLARDLAGRYALPVAQVELLLAGFEREGALVSGDFDPRGDEREWCDPEILRRIRRLTLARLREEVAPVGGDALTRFLTRWQGVDRDAAGARRLEEVLDQLEGLPVSFEELETTMLPARLDRYDARMLDELGGARSVGVGRARTARRAGRPRLPVPP